MKVAEGLLLRKQLEAKLKQLEPLKLQGENGLLETKTDRRKINDNIDEVTITTPKVTLAEITKEYDRYATQLRKLDTAIQKANWENELDFEEEKTEKKTETTPRTATRKRGRPRTR